MRLKMEGVESPFDNLSGVTISLGPPPAQSPPYPRISTFRCPSSPYFPLKKSSLFDDLLSKGIPSGIRAGAPYRVKEGMEVPLCRLTGTGSAGN